MRRLLVITYHFPPDGAVGGLRWSGLSKYLARRGWEIHVVTASTASERDEIPGVRRHECRRRRTLNDAYKSFVMKRRGDAPAADAALDVAAAARRQRTSGLVAAALGFVRDIARVALGFPDSARGWVLRAGFMARDLVSTGSFDAVVTSGPPHSAHFAGLIATLGQDVPHLVDMRDPLRERRFFGRLDGMPAHWLYTLLGPLEFVLFRHAAAVIANTREFADSLKSRQPRLRVVHVPNGTDLEGLPPRTAERFDGFSIAHVGTIYAGRKLTPVLAAFADFVHERPGPASRVTLRMAGAMNTAELEREIADFGLSERVHLYGSLPRPDALALLCRSHLALVLAQAQHSQVPAKLYECVGLGVPTLAITEPTSATATMAQHIGAFVVDADDAQALRRVFHDLVDGRVPATVTPTQPVSYEALADQMDRILQGDCRTDRNARPFRRDEASLRDRVADVRVAVGSTLAE